MAIKFLMIDKCCFYIPLKTGVKFFGFLSLIGSMLLLILGCFDIAYIVYWMTGDDTNDISAWEIALVFVDMLVQIIQSCTATLLLLGVYQAKAKLIPYWLISTPIVALLETTILRNVTFEFFHIRFRTLNWYIVNTITVFDDIYGWVVAYSYYHSLPTPEAAVA